jgi:hypothetical protein
MKQIVIFISLLCVLALVQTCLAGQDEDDIKKTIENFHLAWRDKDMITMDEIWSHEDDVRFITYTEIVSENNFDAHGWSLVSQLIGAGMVISGGDGEFSDINVKLDKRGAVATFNSNIAEPYSNKGFALLRKENNNWKIYLWDATGLLADKTGNETGDYVELAFEAEDGKGANNFVSQDPDASGGKYIVDIDLISFEFSLPIEGKYTIWCRTFAPDSDHNSFSVIVDNKVDRWDVGTSPSWVWNQINRSLNMGPDIFTLSNGKHTLNLNRQESGSKLDAIYITNNLDLWAEQIPQRFGITIGYIENPSTVEAKEKAITTWAKIKNGNM